MSTQLLPRFAFRLLVPAIALGAMAMLGEPLPNPAQATPLLVQVEAAHEAKALTLALRLEAEAAKKAARQTASQMRWFLTVPAAGSRRCSTPGCAS